MAPKQNRAAGGSQGAADDDKARDSHAYAPDAPKIKAPSVELAIENALAAFPDLTPNGFGGGCLEKLNPHEVETAIAFLNVCGGAKQPTVGSYSLKHLAEDWGGKFAHCPYISNGAVIVAAHALGFVIRPHGGGIGVAKRGLNKITQPARRGRS